MLVRIASELGEFNKHRRDFLVLFFFPVVFSLNLPGHCGQCYSSSTVGLLVNISSNVMLKLVW